VKPIRFILHRSGDKRSRLDGSQRLFQFLKAARAEYSVTCFSRMNAPARRIPVRAATTAAGKFRADAPQVRVDAAENLHGFGQELAVKRKFWWKESSGAIEFQSINTETKATGYGVPLIYQFHHRAG
jgi:hypothetical protein